MSRRTRPALAALAVVALCAGTAHAQPTGQQQAPPADVAKSRELFDQGRKHAAAGEYRTACPLLQAANDLNRTNGTALSLADCYEKLGQPERALPYYESIVAAGDEKFPDRVAHARARIEAIEAKSEAPAPAPAAPVETPPAQAAKPAPPDAPAPAPETGVGPSRVPVYIAFGVGAAGVAVGSIFGALALSQAGDVDDACPGGRCADDADVGPQSDAQDSARAKGWVSTVGFGVGLVGVAAGVVLLVTEGDAGPVRADARGVRVLF